MKEEEILEKILFNPHINGYKPKDIDPQKLAAYLLSERQAREALEERVAKLEAIEEAEVEGEQKKYGNW